MKNNNKLELLPKKGLKIGSKLFLYCFTPEDRKKYKKASIEKRYHFLDQLVKNGNITEQQKVNILLGNI